MPSAEQIPDVVAELRRKVAEDDLTQRREVVEADMTGRREFVQGVQLGFPGGGIRLAGGRRRQQRRQGRNLGGRVRTHVIGHFVGRAFSFPGVGHQDRSRDADEVVGLQRETPVRQS
ncbi:hypothetical protein [Streptomyces sp. NPDC047725]|uniref:hypothetical protein n=1 Tax=Streptomyces sp. NPDC047725 TaxID=3365487 RepID=UPI0037120975